MSTTKHTRPCIGRVFALLLAVELCLAYQPATSFAGDPSITATSGGPSAAVLEPEEKLAAATSDSGGLGVYYDVDSKEFVAVYPLALPDSATASAIQATSLPIRIERRDITVETVEAIQAELETRTFAEGAEKATFGTYFDPRTGRIVIDTTGDARIFDAVVDKYPDKIEVQDGLEGGRDSRNADTAPHWGGAYINSALGGCTSGYAVTKAGTKFMVTAAHCADLGAAITGGTGLAWGNVTNRGPFPAWDVELIGGNYAGSIYTGNATGTQQHVKGAGDPAVGSTSYCISGRASNETCGHHAVSLSGSLCDPSGCTNGLAVFNDGTLTGPGDSGAPWYNYPAGGGVTIRGSHVGRIGANMYAERWLAVKAHWTLTIVVS